MTGCPPWAIEGDVDPVPMQTSLSVDDCEFWQSAEDTKEKIEPRPFSTPAEAAALGISVDCANANNPSYQPPVPDQTLRRQWELAGGFVWSALSSIRSKSRLSNVRYRRGKVGRRDRLA